ncbi:hypothetical protein K437DRAFT_257168 [Tilletiaria anomala UBC 951]|uniref:Nnf1-domain-containing protein n=1 Tax=Tilletiaria anomala (strain ATCC 24038 / CBS 436.72 / UBC 951) TaxID=1037660 RepID=A0A066VV05_TILAU|nr:uncharacterized protein K437DRAFT_257168 [Tilletiaria anomala UBC 951]KDN44128.1 hypothetical protein K437DRAFT_257168 [Tilletiaria anomala UBC 951]
MAASSSRGGRSTAATTNTSSTARKASGSGNGSGGGKSNKEKPRIDKLRAALEQFAEILDAAATSQNFASAIPQIEPELAEGFRVQFLQGLKCAIAENNETLIEEHDLTLRLNELDALVAEANERAESSTSTDRSSNKGKHRESVADAASAGQQSDADEGLKDVWRPNLDIQTALLARSNPDRADRIRKLETELDKIRQANRKRRDELRDTRAKALAKQQHAADTLDSLMNSIAALQPNAQLDESMKDLKEAILTELGPRS